MTARTWRALRVLLLVLFGTFFMVPLLALLDFSTTDRYLDMPDGRRARTEWRTPVSGWQEVNGRRLPQRARAVWQLQNGPFPYADFTIEPNRVAFNVPPT